MDIGYEKEPFETLKIKTSVVKKFRRYCRSISKSQSMSLLVMIEFFEDNGISPKESIGPHIQALANLIKKRNNAVIAIMKDIEKTQTKPTNAMINLLFKEAEEDEEEEEQILLEEVLSDGISEEQFTEHKELEYYHNQYFETKSKFNDLKDDFEMVLKKTKYIRNNFGIGHFRLEITKEEFENLKNKLEHVHHNNSPKTNG